jgi:hypothetical protein
MRIADGNDGSREVLNTSHATSDAVKNDADVADFGFGRCGRVQLRHCGGRAQCPEVSGRFRDEQHGYGQTVLSQI